MEIAQKYASKSIWHNELCKTRLYLKVIKIGSLTFSDFILELLIPAFQLVNPLIQSIIFF